MGTGSFPRVKRPGRGTDHSPPIYEHRGWRKSRAVPLLLLWAFLSCYRVNFACTFIRYQNVFCSTNAPSGVLKRICSIYLTNLSMCWTFSEIKKNLNFQQRNVCCSRWKNGWKAKFKKRYAKYWRKRVGNVNVSVSNKYLLELPKAIYLRRSLLAWQTNEG
jgi:hypothetical protein